MPKPVMLMISADRNFVTAAQPSGRAANFLINDPQSSLGIRQHFRM